MSTHLQFVIPGEAVPWARPRAQRTGPGIRFFTKPEVENYQALVKKMAHDAIQAKPEAERTAWPAQGAVNVTIDIARDVPKSFSQKKAAEALNGQHFPTTKPDVDNTVKGIFDALNGIVWKDDSQVVRLFVTKGYSRQPRVIVNITDWP